jgi:hypothetical protein
MMGVSRSVFQFRRFIESRFDAMGRALEVSFIAVSSVVLVVLWAVTADRTGWTGVLQGMTANVMSGLTLALFAYALFVLRFRYAKLREYRRRWRWSQDRAPDGSRGLTTRRSRAQGGAARMRSQPSTILSRRDALMESVVDELLAARPPRSCLFVGGAELARPDALVKRPALLAARGMVPVVLDLRGTNTSNGIPLLARDRFVTRLVGSAGDAASGGRVFTNMASRQKMVAVVAGLTSVGVGTSRLARREAVANLLLECLEERLPFVAGLPHEVAPSISEIAVLRVEPLHRAELAAYVLERLTSRGIRPESRARAALASALDEAFARAQEPTREPSYLELASDLLFARLRGGQAPADAVSELFAERSAFRRHLEWMCERAVGCHLAEARQASSAAAFALATVGTEMHYRQDLETTWEDASQSLDAAGRRRFAAGMAVLLRREVLLAGDGTAALQFSNPGWSAFAVALGVGLERAHWADVLGSGTGQMSLDGLSAALVMNPASVGTGPQSFLSVIDRLQGPVETERSLDLVVAVIAGLQLVGDPTYGDDEIEALEQAWRASTDTIRLSFISAVEIARDPALIEFLWRRVIPPDFHETSFLVRRAICQKIASLGEDAWDVLQGRSVEATDAALAGDLSSQQLPDWDRCGLTVASLCWILPSMVVHVDATVRPAVLTLLEAVRRVALNGWDGGVATAEATDIGIEISLAEGFKIAGAEMAVAGRVAEAWWGDEAESLLASVNSWVSQQALLQAIALADPAGTRATRLARATLAVTAGHPFVRETAALVLRASADTTPDHPYQDIWPDDVRALNDGGYDLTLEAHRLLGLSTLLINLAENARIARGDGAASRERVLTSDSLPRCFVGRGHSATLFEFPCDCEYGLCGRSAKGQVGDRRFSRAFVGRSMTACRSHPLSGRGAFAGHTFLAGWRALDGELTAE